MKYRSLLGLAALLPLLACEAEAPYVYTDFRAHQMGYVKVCYSTDNATPAQVRQLAEDVCNHYERTAQLELQQKGQCSWTAPTLAMFACVARPGETPPLLVRKNAPMHRHDETSVNY